MEMKDEISNKCNPKDMSRCLSMPYATSLHHCQAAKTNMASVVGIQEFRVAVGLANTFI